MKCLNLKLHLPPHSIDLQSQTTDGSASTNMQDLPINAVLYKTYAHWTGALLLGGLVLLPGAGGGGALLPPAGGGGLVPLILPGAALVSWQGGEGRHWGEWRVACT